MIRPEIAHPQMVRPQLVRPTSARPAVRARRRLAVGVVASMLLLSGCTSAPEQTGAEEASATQTEMPFNSEFSRDGTFQSHADVDGVDFVFTIWAAKATPRMAEWRPKGDKFFSFTFQAYDTRQQMRAPFKTKRLVWLERVQVTSATTTDSGTVETPFSLDEWAPDITFDPEARTSGRKGMLITSPKGAFELRNQVIKDLADDTQGVTLTFRAVVHMQTKPGAKTYVKREISQTIPVAIHQSKYPTIPQPIPFNAS